MEEGCALTALVLAGCVRSPVASANLAFTAGVMKGEGRLWISEVQLLDIAAALSVSFFHRLEVANGERNHLGGDRTTLSLVGVKKGLASPVAEDPASFHPRL